MNKRRLVEAALLGSGLADLRWRMLPAGLYCFNFHRVGDALHCPFDRGVFSCSEQQFERVVGELKDRFEIVTLGRLREIQQGHQVYATRPLALLTFDDGYVDNFTVVFRVLNRHDVKGVFFVPTSYIESDRIPWWDEIAWSVRNARNSEIRLRGRVEPVCIAEGDPERTVRNLLRLIKRRTDVPVEESVSEIREACAAPSIAEALGRQRLFMTWDNLREISIAGHDVGSHGVTHRILAHLPVAQQLDELKNSKKEIESRLGCEVLGVSYPVGGEGAFSRETCRLSRAAGYCFGFSFLPGWNRIPLADPWSIRRFGIDDVDAARRWKLRIAFPWLARC
jgi:peptidoglycan/xylan/chitin deacetylase (PgdA/CDA1 family)